MSGTKHTQRSTTNDWVTGYYHKFIPVYAALVKPLTEMTSKMILFIWTDLCQKAFELLNKPLMES